MWERLEAHKKYGKVVRMAPNELSWIDERVWKDVWAHRQGHQEFMKDSADRFKHPNGLYGILLAEREDHSRYRRLLSHAFSEKGMRDQQLHITGYVDMLIKDLRGVADEGPQDMVQWFNVGFRSHHCTVAFRLTAQQWTTFDIIGKLAFGQDFGCLKESKTHPWIEMIFGNLKSLVIIGSIRRLGLEWILPYIASSKQLEARLYNYRYSNDMIKARVERGDDQHDFWDNVLKHSDKSTGMSTDEMVSNGSNLVLAGSETTATLLSGCIYQLCKNPDVMKKVTDEIRSAYTSDTEIDLFSTGQLKYTLAVLDESMRIYSPVPTQANRTVPAGGDTVLGQYLPGGTVISMSQAIAHHYPPYWTKPEEFHPERFLGAEEFKNDNFEVMQPFSVGSRNCIGRNLAYAEMRLILARFLWNFNVQLDRRTAEEGEWTDQKTFTL
jgi:averantin hydroxylase